MNLIPKFLNTDEESASRRNYLSDNITNLIQLAKETSTKAFRNGLDVGCGNGELTKDIIRKTGITFEGIDPAPLSSHTLKIIKGYADDLPYPDNSFDLVTLISVLSRKL